jgi:hypothetical protein
MSVSDNTSLLETPDRIETELSEPVRHARDITLPRHGYQNLFRAVCLPSRKTPTDSR